jgi:hypothetical protein
MCYQDNLNSGRLQLSVEAVYTRPVGSTCCRTACTLSKWGRHMGGGGQGGNPPATTLIISRPILQYHPDDHTTRQLRLRPFNGSTSSTINVKKLFPPTTRGGMEVNLHSRRLSTKQRRTLTSMFRPPLPLVLTGGPQISNGHSSCEQKYFNETNPGRPAHSPPSPYRLLLTRTHDRRLCIPRNRTSVPSDCITALHRQSEVDTLENKKKVIHPVTAVVTLCTTDFNVQ